VSVLQLVFGLIFFLMAARIWRGRPKPGQEAQMPEWMQAVDDFTAGKSLGTGVVLSAANPKNLVLTIAAATAIAQTGIPGGEEAVALAVFVLIGSLTILAAVTTYLVLGTRAEGVLGGLKTFMATHNAAIMTVLLLVLGAKLIGDAIAGF
jgi:threonine/homoserine/homoserine lactone efflux protein